MEGIPTPSSAGTSVMSPSTQPRGQRKQQEYSCILCKSRKVRCDRRIPCSGCVKAGAKCVPGSRRPYKRRKRHEGDAPGTNPPSPRQTSDVPSHTEGRPPRNDVPSFGARLWVGLNDEFRVPQPDRVNQDDEDTPDSQADNPFPDPSLLVFAATPRDVDLRGYYPTPMNAFTLWQTYLQNVNPLSKVIDAPVVQRQVLDASRDFNSVSRPTIALLFSVFATAVYSMPDDECLSTLGEPRKVLHARYVSACQQALVAAAFIRSRSLVVLQAYLSLLLAVRNIYDPHTCFILMGIALRMGQRLRLNDPNSEATESIYHVQFRRRLWWQILLVDGRSYQVSGIPQVFSDRFNTPLPANVNDTDLAPNMTEAPSPHKGATEMIFCLPRYETGMFLNNHWSTLYSHSVPIEEKDKLINDFEAHLTSEYIKHCDLAIPIHMLAMGVIRTAIGNIRLTVHHPSRSPDKGRSMPQSERDMLFSTAVELTEVDVLGQTMKGLRHFAWHMKAYFRVDTLVFMLIESRSQPPVAPLTDKAWCLVDEEYKCRPELMDYEGNELYAAVSELVLRAWAAREAAARRENLPLPPVPDFILKLRDKKADRATLLSNGPEHPAGPGESLGGTQPIHAQAPELQPSATTSDSANQPDLEDLFDGIFDPYASEAQLSGWGEVNWPYWDNLVTQNTIQYQ